jgi:RNA polymerase sigma factor (sigma-70 family)
LAAVPSRGRASEVEQAAAPEADATRALYERYAGPIYGFCLHRLGSREEAEDAVQTTFLNAFRGLRRGVVPDAESAWLFKIAENVCLTRQRSAWRRGRVEAPSDMQALQDVTPARERGGEELLPLGDALAAMPETQRRAILLREWQGLSYREIAGELGVSQSAVETLIFRARRSLANALETPWRDRRAAGQAGRRAFDVTSLLAGLKALLAGGTAAKVAAVAAVAATGTAALAVAESRHPSSPARVEPSRAAARAPDSVRSPAIVVPLGRRQEDDARAGAPARVTAKLGRAKPAAPATRDSSAAVEKAEKKHSAVPETSQRPETPPGQAKDRGTPASPRARAERSSGKAAPKAKARPQAKPRPAAKSKPKVEQPKAEQPKASPPTAPPPAAEPPSGGKEKDEAK